MIQYSICVCNYNMAGTLERAMASILDQLDERFEMVIVDDGSSDGSIKAVERLQKRYPGLIRLVALPRDATRRLGFTRNISLEEARGVYALLHLDCDDITAPYIKDFITLFHRIETCFERPFLLSGAPIQMGNRAFLLSQGPYRNINRGEDRDMLSRLAAEGRLVPFAHKSFKTRLPKTLGERIYRSVYYTYDSHVNTFRAGESLMNFLRLELGKNQNRFSFRTRLMRLALTGPGWIAARFKGPLPRLSAQETLETPEERVAHRLQHGGTYAQIMARHGKDADWSGLSPAARAMFDLYPGDIDPATGLLRAASEGR